MELTTSRRAAGWTAPEIAFAAFLLFAFGTGLIAHLTPRFLPLTRYTTDPLLLLINGFLLWLIYRRNRDSRLWWWVVIAYAGTFATEALGVATGLIFGEYAYGATMRIQWLGVPLVIALNWTLLILATNDLARRIIDHPLAVSLLASVMIAAYDYFIEPVAILLDYWQWEGGIVPVQNYVAWSLVALVFSLPLNFYRIRYRSPVLPVYLLAQLLFFILLAAWL